MGGVFFGTQNSECQILITFSFWLGVFMGTQNSKCQVLTKFHFWGGGGSGECILGYSKLKVPSSDKIFIFGSGVEERRRGRALPRIGYSWKI